MTASLDGIDWSVRKHGAYLTHQVPEMYDGGEVSFFSLVQTTYGDHAPHTGVDACTCFEVWQRTGSREWELVEPNHGGSVVDWDDYDHNAYEEESHGEE